MYTFMIIKYKYVNMIMEQLFEKSSELNMNSIV